MTLPDVADESHQTAHLDAIKTPPLQLPIVVIYNIIRYLGRPDILRLAQVSRIYHEAAEPHIWEAIQIRLPAHYGEYPKIYPGLDSSGSIYARMRMQKEEPGGRAWATDVENISGAAARQKAEDVLQLTDRRKWGMVRRITLDSRRDALPAMIQMMVLASPNLAILEITPAIRYDMIRSWDSHERLVELYGPGLELLLLDTPIHFPSLTTVRLGKNSIRYASWLSTFCAMAPNLISLDLDLDHELYDDELDVQSYPIPGNNPETKIRCLRLSFQSTGSTCPGTHGFPTEFRSLIASSPALQQLSLRLNESFSTSPHVVYADLQTIIPEIQDLEDLHWSGAGAWLDCIDPQSSDHMPALRRLLLEPECWHDLFRKLLPILPWVTIVYLCTGNPVQLDQIGPSEADHSNAPLRMITSFSDDLRGNPMLWALGSLYHPHGASDIGLFDRIDEIDRREEYTGYVNSYIHGEEEDDELLHAILLLDYVEVSDEECTPVVRAAEKRDCSERLVYKARDGTLRVKTYEKSEPAWYHFTDYLGCAVPLEILEEMREVEGLSQDQWRRRGVPIGAGAWAILTTWTEKHRAEHAGAHWLEVPP